MNPHGVDEFAPENYFQPIENEWTECINCNEEFRRDNTKDPKERYCRDCYEEYLWGLYREE